MGSPRYNRYNQLAPQNGHVSVYISSSPSDPVQRLVSNTGQPACVQSQRLGRIKVRGQPQQIVLKTPSQKNPSQKRAGRVAQGEGPEFRPQHCNKEINIRQSGE
jgi:hypothetical protein